MKLKDRIILCEDLNLFLTNFIERLPCDTDSEQDICVSCLLDMLRGTSLTVVCLAKMGCLKDIELLLRPQFERLIKLKKVCMDSSYAVTLIKQSESDRLKFINIARNRGQETLGHMGYSLLRKAITESEFESLKTEVEQMESVASVLALAQQTGLLSEYILYRFYSRTTHCASSEMDDCLKIENGEIELIPYGSGRVGDLIPTILSSMHIVLTGISAVAERYGIDVQKRLDEFRKVLNNSA